MLDNYVCDVGEVLYIRIEVDGVFLLRALIVQYVTATECFRFVGQYIIGLDMISTAPPPKARFREPSIAKNVGSYCSFQVQLMTGEKKEGL